MIWNEEILFIHVPKTGGMMMTHELLKTLKRPVYYSVPIGHEGNIEDGIIVVPGKRHEFLDEAVTILDQYNIKLEDFKYILAVIRNPYDLEVSRFAYLRKGYEYDKGKDQELALKGNFNEFVLYSPFQGREYPEIQRFYTVDGMKPDNLYILRYENIERDFALFLKKLGINVDKFPVRNASSHLKFTTYLDPKVEQFIYIKYQWLFEQKYYRRWKPDIKYYLKKFMPIKMFKNDS